MVRPRRRFPNFDVSKHYLPLKKIPFNRLYSVRAVNVSNLAKDFKVYFSFKTGFTDIGGVGLIWIESEKVRAFSAKYSVSLRVRRQVAKRKLSQL